MRTTKDVAKDRVKKINAYHKVFKYNVDGKEVLKDLIRCHHMLQPSFSKDALEMAFHEGERNVVLRILTQIHTNPEELQKFIEEANNEE